MSLQSIAQFDVVAADLCLDAAGYWFRVNPSPSSKALLERIKDCARMLSKAGSIQRTKALECMAGALGFPNWHTLNAHLNKPDSFSGEISNNWLDRLTHSIILMVDTAPDLALPASQIVAFRELAERLSRISGCPVDTILDKVCAGLCGASNWLSVETRSPLQTTEPLYRFEIDRIEPNSGRFIESPACEQLIEELDSIYQDATTADEIRKARIWIEKTLVKQPGFLEAGLCLAQIHYDTNDGDLRLALSTIDRFIKQTEALIPTGYRGKILWGWVSNRFYHRMLWLRMNIYQQADWMREALKGARKQLRLNPTDNLGVRYIYPLMLLETEQYEKALKAARFPKESGHQVALIRSFCFYTTGNKPKFIKELTTALFDLPVLREILLDGAEEVAEEDRYRGVIPSMDVLIQYAWPAYMSAPGLTKACIEFLSEPIVKQAETELARISHDRINKNG
ncbi:hypothetical protein OD783_35545 [Pseudomonas aeruginosa]|nr:hypothetical protein [Pseudomonas aeruginosa]MCV4065596.1 hypothetical protein [Pseudomonas aeruginosa]